MAYLMHYERGSLHACISNIVMWWYNWGVLCQKPVSSAWTGNYIPEYLWYVITCPSPWYVILTQHSWIKNDRKRLFSTKFIWYQDMKMIIRPYDNITGDYSIHSMGTVTIIVVTIPQDGGRQKWWAQPDASYGVLFADMLTVVVEA